MVHGLEVRAPSSGSQPWVRWRWACPKFPRQTFHEWSWLSVRKSKWARAYYDGQRAKGSSHHAAVRALAFKWLRIIFRCWTDRCPYDEAKYLQRLKNRSLKDPKKTKAEILWESKAGFSKAASISC